MRATIAKRPKEAKPYRTGSTIHRQIRLGFVLGHGTWPPWRSLATIEVKVIPNGITALLSGDCRSAGTGPADRYRA